MDIIEKATHIAVQAHKEQFRKTDGSSYVVHPLMVARIVEKYGLGDEVVAAAIVHDVLEDTAVHEAELRAQLDDTVTDIVLAVSEDKTLPWKERKQRYIESIVSASEAVKAVSIADKIHNAQSLIEFHGMHGETTWEKFNVGREDKIWFERALLDQLRAVWQHPLLDEYEELVRQVESLV